jgi:hypothetical protein
VVELRGRRLGLGRLAILRAREWVDRVALVGKGIVDRNVGGRRLLDAYLMRGKLRISSTIGDERPEEYSPFSGVSGETPAILSYV